MATNLVCQLWLTFDPVYHQAVGMISAQLGTNLEDAELRLLEAADRAQMPVRVLVREVTSRTRRFYN